VNFYNPELNPKDDYLEVYTIAIYFVSSTMATVGFGDVRATRSKEYFFVIVLLLAGSLLFSWFSGALRATMMSKDELTVESYIEEMNENLELVSMRL